MKYACNELFIRRINRHHDLTIIVQSYPLLYIEAE